ncbi:MAG: Fic family protein [Acidimicrobiaceae bacterium]|nr:Fic family protein [Acidimicrobiaceae bacterium]
MPKPLPPDPPLRWDTDLLGLLSEATTALGRLDGLAGSLPNPDLFVASYVRREAVLSSQIEGTQSSLDDVFAHEVEAGGPGPPADIAETVNHVRAMHLGLSLLDELPLSGRLIRRVHEELMTGVRGQERSPGEFRKTQNWVGPAGCTLETAAFVPPSPDDLPVAIRDLEVFLNDSDDPPLVLAGLAHAQFETIHPFLDGNGRVGRLLITLLLVQRRVLARPLLYLSLFLKRNRLEYYDRLNAIRAHGDWEGWLGFFLSGVAITASDALRVAGELSALTDEHRRVATAQRFGKYGWPLLDLLAEWPIMTIKRASNSLGANPTTVGRLLDQMAAAGIVAEITGQRRNRVYRYSPFLDVLVDDSEPA